MEITTDELKAAAEAVVELLNAKGSQYTTIIIQQYKIVVTQDELAIPLPIKD